MRAERKLVTSAALLRILLLLEQGASLRVLPPELDQRLANQEEHRADLADGEEAPDGRLLHEVGRDVGGQDGARQEEESALDHHALLFVQREERSVHQEAVDLGAWDVVRWVCHGDGPGEVVFARERAELLAAQPFGGLAGVGAGREGDVHGVGGHGEHGDVEQAQRVGPAQQEADEEAAPTDQAEALDDVVLQLVLGAVGEGSVDHVAVVGLQADVQEAEHSKELVDEVIAPGGLEVLGDDEVLKALQELHSEEEEDATGEL